MQACHELKVVVHGPEDISFAAAMASQCEDDTERLLQPGWESSIGEAWLWSMCVNTPNGASACKATNGWESAERCR